MIERMTPDQYEQREISGIPPQEEDLNKEFALQKEISDYVYGMEVEPEPELEPEVAVEVEVEKPPVQYIPVAQAPPAPSIPWGLIGVIAVTGLIALSIVAVVVAKK